ncbi:hypothetical protein [Nesterenkonia pannonica]|uniref:ABC transporter ATP-binding protein n=1 Tax=Nesterenkonia pannonica TaxID=1548602 RepID=UPI00216493D1|nr:hypothetical protein [Nesterenkonia pannonica]
MRQRIVIAIALASDPKVLIADEATTALDVTTQAQIMELLVDIQERLGTAVIMISHDIGLAANYAHDVMVMYAGKVVEHANTKSLFSNVQMPYTKALLGAVPQLTTVPHSKLTVIGGHPGPEQPAAGVPLCSTLPPRHGRVHGGGTAIGAAERPAQLRVLASRRRSAAGDCGNRRASHGRCAGRRPSRGPSIDRRTRWIRVITR